jgi:hypothetical protein
MSNTGLTIAQALRKIKKLKGHYSEYKGYANNSVSYEELNPPEFKFQEQVDLMVQTSNEMVELEAAVAVANATNTFVYKGKLITLSYAVRMLQEMKGLIAFYKTLFLRNEICKEKEQVWHDEKSQYVTVSTEKKFVSALSEKDKVALIKGLEDDFESLNNLVEDSNHRVLV